MFFALVVVVAQALTCAPSKWDLLGPKTLQSRLEGFCLSLGLRQLGVTEELSVGANGARWRAANVTCQARDKSPLLRFSHLDVTVVDLLSRLQSRGGEYRARVSVTSEDLRESKWVRKGIELLLPLLQKHVVEPLEIGALHTYMENDRVIVDATTVRGSRFRATFKLAAENDALMLRNPIVRFDDDVTYMINDIPVPLQVAKDAATLYLSALAVDASRTSFRVADADVVDDTIQLELYGTPRVSTPILVRRRTGTRQILEPTPDRTQVRLVLDGRDDAPPIRHGLNVDEFLPWPINANKPVPSALAPALAFLAVAPQLPKLVSRKLNEFKSDDHDVAAFISILLRTSGKELATVFQDDFPPPPRSRPRARAFVRRIARHFKRPADRRVPEDPPTL